MSFKAVIKDYQSLESVTLEANELTVVTGRSNLGKSALIRAVAAAWFGQYGEAFVRRGQSMTAVGVRFDDGQSIKWYKVPASKKVPGKESSLEINGQKHTKVGKEHDLLTAPLGLRALEAGGGYYFPQVARQFDPIFLIGENESTAAEIFRVLGKGDVVAHARGAAKKDHGAVLSEEKVKRQDFQGLDEDLKKREWSVDLVKVTEDLVSKATLLEGRQQVVEGTLKELNELAALPAVEIPVIPEAKDLETKQGMLECINQALSLHVSEVPVEPPMLDASFKINLWLQVGSAQEIGVLSVAVDDTVARSQAEAKTVLDELELLKKQLGTCPLCDQPLRTHQHT